QDGWSHVGQYEGEASNLTAVCSSPSHLGHTKLFSPPIIARRRWPGWTNCGRLKIPWDRTRKRYSVLHPRPRCHWTSTTPARGEIPHNRPPCTTNGNRKP